MNPWINPYCTLLKYKFGKVGGDANELYFPQGKYCGNKWHPELLVRKI